VIALQSAGDLSAECTYTINDNFTPESNRERDHFLKLLNKFTNELSQVQQQHKHQSMNCCSQRLDLLEVFCGPQSQLTHQSQQLGYKAERFSHLLRPKSIGWWGADPRMYGFLQHAVLGAGFHVSMEVGPLKPGMSCSKPDSDMWNKLP
jgi:hypothetical protein